jgi:hypothetical protein
LQHFSKSKEVAYSSNILFQNSYTGVKGPHVQRIDHRFRMFENKVFSRIFGQKTEEETGSWRKLIIRNLIIILVNKYF